MPKGDQPGLFDRSKCGRELLRLRPGEPDTPPRQPGARVATLISTARLPASGCPAVHTSLSGRSQLNSAAELLGLGVSGEAPRRLQHSHAPLSTWPCTTEEQHDSALVDDAAPASAEASSVDAGPAPSRYRRTASPCRHQDRPPRGRGVCYAGCSPTATAAVEHYTCRHCPAGARPVKRDGESVAARIGRDAAKTAAASPGCEDPAHGRSRCQNGAWCRCRDCRAPAQGAPVEAAGLREDGSLPLRG